MIDSPEEITKSGSGESDITTDPSADRRDSVWSWHSWARDKRTTTRYVSFFAIVFFVSVYWSFPRTVLRDYLVRKVESNSRMRFEVDNVDTHWLTGLSLTNVRLTEISSMSEHPLHLEFDALKVRVALWDLLRGRQGAVIVAESGDGEATIAFSQSGDATHLSLDFEDWDLRHVLTTGLYGLPIFGQIDGEAELDISVDPKGSDGEWDIKIHNFALGDGKSEFKAPGLMMGITMDRTRFGTLALKSAVIEGAAKMQVCNAQGLDAELRCGGTLFLAHPFNASRSDILMRFRFTDAYKEKHGWVQGLDALMDFTPQLKGAKSPDGALQYKMTGSFSGLLKFTAAGQLPKP